MALEADEVSYADLPVNFYVLVSNALTSASTSTYESICEATGFFTCCFLAAGIIFLGIETEEAFLTANLGTIFFIFNGLTLVMGFCTIAFVSPECGFIFSNLIFFG